MDERRDGQNRIQTWAFVAVPLIALLGVVVLGAQAFPRLDDLERRASQNEAVVTDVHERLIRMEEVGKSTQRDVAELKRLAEGE